MNSPYIFTFIIGYRHNNERFNNLKRTLEWVNSFSGVEIILVEQDKHSKISHLNLGCKQIFVKSNKPYNRSWAFNVGLKYATSPIIVFGDSDLIMKPDEFISSIQKINEFDMVSPYSSVIDLTPEETNLPLGNVINIDRAGRGELDNQKINICGGITIFKKEAIERIGGWDERFVGWGAEDDFQTIKVENFIKYSEEPYRCYHLYHTRNQPDMNLYAHNIKLLEDGKKLSVEQLVSYIAKVRNNIGSKNKYDN